MGSSAGVKNPRTTYKQLEICILQLDVTNNLLAHSRKVTLFPEGKSGATPEGYAIGYN